jgi:hypothetical protein
MPVSAAAQWIATKGGTIPFKPNDESYWKPAYSLELNVEETDPSGQPTEYHRRGNVFEGIGDIFQKQKETSRAVEKYEEALNTYVEAAKAFKAKPTKYAENIEEIRKKLARAKMDQRQ